MSKKPVPKKQQAKSQSRSRHSKWIATQRKKLEDRVVLDKCPTTGETKLRHFASAEGNYKGRQLAGAKTQASGKKAVKAIEA